MNSQPSHSVIVSREDRTDIVSPSPGELPYEPPMVVPIGNLRDLLGKSGARNDATYRRPNSGRP